MFHTCPKYNAGFQARPLIRTDPATGKQEFHCQVCAKKGRGKKSWHYLKKIKFGYAHSAVKTAYARSKDRTPVEVHRYCEENFKPDLAPSLSTVRRILQEFAMRRSRKNFAMQRYENKFIDLHSGYVNFSDVYTEEKNKTKLSSN